MTGISNGAVNQVINIRPEADLDQYYRARNLISDPDKEVLHGPHGMIRMVSGKPQKGGIVILTPTGCGSMVRCGGADSKPSARATAAVADRIL